MDTINKDNPNPSEGSISREPTVSQLVVNCLKKTLETIGQFEDMEGLLAVNEEGEGLTRRIQGTNIFGTDEVIVQTRAVGTSERNGGETTYTSIVSIHNNSPESPLVIIADSLSEGTFKLQVIKVKNVGFNQLVRLYGEGGRISQEDIEEFEIIQTNKGVVEQRKANCGDKYLQLREGDQVPTELSRLINQISLPFSQRVKQIMATKENNS